MLSDVRLLVTCHPSPGGHKRPATEGFGSAPEHQSRLPGVTGLVSLSAPHYPGHQSVRDPAPAATDIGQCVSLLTEGGELLNPCEIVQAVVLMLKWCP